jgi:hypothetical protein
MRLRALVSLGTALTFVVMAATGAVLFIVPQGRIAYWTGWRFLGVTKEAWGDVHVVFCLLFLAAAGLHVWLNWKPLYTHAVDRMRRGLALRREFFVMLALAVVAVAGTLFGWPPFAQVVALNERIKASWVRPGLEPPFGHAEQMPLSMLYERLSIDPAAADADLAGNATPPSGPADTLQAIARRHGTSPAALYAVIRKRLPKRDPPPAARTYTPGLVFERFDGTGIGRKSFSDMCREARIDPGRAREKLAEKGMVAGDHETLKEVANRYQSFPIEILKVILDGEPVDPGP